MIEIFPNLFVGSGDDMIHADNGEGGALKGWSVISAAKDPWHREAVGYTGRGAPKTMVENGVEIPHPEYLLARRERRLICNLIDVDDPAFIREEIVTAVIEAIDTALDVGDRVLLHCNQGQSRAPTLALLWARYGTVAPLVHAAMALLTFDQAFEAMRQVYPLFGPSKGMEGYARARWEAE